MSFYQRRIWLRYRGLLLFILFSFLPYCISFVVSAVPLHLLNDSRLIMTSVIYGCSLVLFIVVQSVRATHFDFFRINVLSVALVSIAVGVAAYIAALSVTFSIINILSCIFRDGLPAWVTASNQGFISFLDGDDAFVKILWFLMITAAAPVIEEIVFRGYLQDYAAQLCLHRMPILTAVVSSFIFALFHINSLANMIFAFIVGLFLSDTVQRHGSLIPSMIVHGTVNTVSLLVGMLIR
ncbi:MAG: CPBP family intramembrane metalloprotease [Spirochaetales bacterium]|nr:CPBP family intramembrane metalloprotease [Spirochaetales bacterium]